MNQKRGLLFYIAIAAFIGIVIFPFLWVLLASLKAPLYLYGEYAFSIKVPEYTLQNYISVFTNHPFGRYLLNSFTVGVLTMFLSISIAAFASYAVARLYFLKTFFSAFCSPYPCCRKSPHCRRCFCLCNPSVCATRTPGWSFPIQPMPCRLRYGT